jgi:chromosome segregation ATPase
MKTEKIAILILAVLLVASLAGFALYLQSASNKNLAFAQTAEERIVELQAQLDATTAERAGLRDRLTERNQELERQTREAEQARTTARTQANSMTAQQQRIRQLNQSVAQLQEELSEAKASLTTVAGERDAAVSQSAERKAKLNKAIVLIKKQQAAMRAQKAEIASLKKPVPAPAPPADPVNDQ